MFQQTDKKYGFETLILVEYFKIHFYTNKYLLSLRTFYEALLIIHNKSLFFLCFYNFPVMLQNSHYFLGINLYCERLAVNECVLLLGLGQPQRNHTVN